MAITGAPMNLGIVRVTKELMANLGPMFGAELAEHLGFRLGHKVIAVRNCFDYNCFDLKISGPDMPLVGFGDEIPFVDVLDITSADCEGQQAFVAVRDKAAEEFMDLLSQDEMPVISNKLPKPEPKPITFREFL
jgi:hypothetical protein